MTVLDEENVGLRKLIANTGVTFDALSRNAGQLRALVTTGEQVFSATARQNRALAQTIQIFPTFLDESKATLGRLRTFALDTDPLVRDLRPVAHDLVPTLRATRQLAPDLKRFFVNLGPLIDASKRGLPALRDILRGAQPLLGQLGPFLSQLNPILQWIEYNQAITSNFMSAGITGIADTTTATGGGVGHYLRQFGPMGPDTVALSPTRQDFTRGNSYPYGANLSIPEMGKFLIIPNHDCNNAGGRDSPQRRARGRALGVLRGAGGARSAAGHAAGRQAGRLQQVATPRRQRGGAPRCAGRRAGSRPSRRSPSISSASSEPSGAKASIQLRWTPDTRASASGASRSSMRTSPPSAMRT